MLQQVFFRLDGATAIASMIFQGSVPLDHVARHLGIATGSLELQTQPEHSSATLPGAVWPLTELRSLCGLSAGTTADNPIVVRETPAAGEREPCSAELSPNRACFRVKPKVPKPNCECLMGKCCQEEYKAYLACCAAAGLWGLEHGVKG